MNEMLTKKEMACKIFVAMNERDLSGLDRIMSQHIVLDFPGAGRIKGRVKVITFLKILLRKYPKLKFNLSDMIEEDNKVCVVWSNTGEYISGNPYKNEGISLFQLFDGKIIFISDYFKDTSFV